MSKHLVIVGAGTGGISTMHALRRKKVFSKITIIDPAETHYYQPLWTLVGGGVSQVQESERSMRSLIPSDVDWVKDTVSKFDPDANIVKTSSGHEIKYDYLIVAAGIQIDWDKIKGLKETLGSNGVSTNYSIQYVCQTWEFIKNLKSGKALFTYPSTPIKCAGAPQKIMYLADDWFRRANVRKEIDIEFVSAGAAIFGVEKYKLALEEVIKDRAINTSYGLDLIEIDGPKKIATFKNMQSNEILTKEFDFIHVTPPMSAPDFIKNSPLSEDSSWMSVDQHSLQHIKYKNVFGLGDCTSTPNSKTGAAIRKQAPVLIDNLIAVVNGQSPNKSYNGYASCPLVTKRGACILAEFEYGGKIAETFPFDQAKERLSMYILKKTILPFLYWNFMMKGYF